VESAGLDRQAGVHLDLVEPVPELVVALEHTFLQRDVALLVDARHLDDTELRAVTMAVLKGLRLHVEARDLLELHQGTVPLHFEVELG
jgi:hypothetical protein